MTMITPIDNIAAINGVTHSSLLDTTQQPSALEEAQQSFGSIFLSAIENVQQTDADKTNAEYLLVTGQLDNPAALTIASTKYELAVDLLVQLRSKAMDAYSELTRMSI
jgi:flagellar hook-basal body complex protein FliE